MTGNTTEGMCDLREKRNTVSNGTDNSAFSAFTHVNTGASNRGDVSKECGERKREAKEAEPRDHRGRLRQSQATRVARRRRPAAAGAAEERSKDRRRSALR